MAIAAYPIDVDGKGVAYIEGTSTKVIEVVQAKQAQEWTPEETQRELPHLTLAQVYAALAYYHANRAELDQQMRERRQLADSLRGAGTESVDADGTASAAEPRGMIPLYMDENVLRAITRGLRARGVDVLTAQEDGRQRTDDRLILERATELKRVLFSQDTDLLIIAAERQQANDLDFSGVIYAHQDEPIGVCIEDIELILGVCTLEELRGMYAICLSNNYNGFVHAGDDFPRQQTDVARKICEAIVYSLLRYCRTEDALNKNSSQIVRTLHSRLDAISQKLNRHDDISKDEYAKVGVIKK